MAASPVEQWVSDLFVAQRRARAHRALILELVDEGHLRAAIDDLRMWAELEDHIDDLVTALHNQYPTADDGDAMADVVDLPAPKTPRRGSKR